MNAPVLTFLPDVLEEHLDEIGFLWSQRHEARFSADYALRDFAELDARIMAHLAGVLATGPRALDIVRAGLDSDDESEVFAAAFSLLHIGDQAGVSLVIDAFESAADNRLDALRSALAMGPAGNHLAGVQALSGSGKAITAIAAADVLARRGAVALPPGWLDRGLEHEDATVRAAAWRLASVVLPTLDPERTLAAIHDEDAATAHAALLAAVWCGEMVALEAVRTTALSPSSDDLHKLYIFAVLAAPSEVSTFERMLDDDALGPDRFELAGTLGHPALAGRIIEEMRNGDPEVAAAAGRAFHKLTGVDVESDERVSLGSETVDRRIHEP